PSPERAAIAEGLQSTLDSTAAGSVHRCHLALELDGRRRGYTVEEWLPAAARVPGGVWAAARLDREPPSVVEHAQQARGWTAIAIDNLDRDAPGVPDAIATHSLDWSGS